MTAMAVTMSVEKAATEAAISHRAILRPAPVGVGPQVWSAVVAPHQAHRYGADGRIAHQRQDHPARSFHGTTCVFKKTEFGKSLVKQDRLTAWYRQLTSVSES
jgi:hypothetical protein